MTKQCKKCGEVKSFDAFHRNRTERDGLARWCRDCMSEAASKWYRAQPDQREKSKLRRREQRAEYPEEEAQRRHAWRAEHPEEAAANRERLRQEYQRNRNALLDHYGRSCACCQSTERLSIDHIHGGGSDHRLTVGGNGAGLYRWLVRNGFPAGFQTLCLPCNQSKGSGECCQLKHQEAA